MRGTFLAILGLTSSAALADEWMLPGRQTYISPGRTARLTVSPRDIQSPLAYFSDKVAHREPAGAPAGSKEQTATAILERADASGRWDRDWAGRLQNEVAPVDVLVADRGAGFATFDDWHGLGYGKNVVVIYRPDGSVARHYALSDLFPNWFIDALPHSVSSIWWRGKPKLSKDETEVVVPVVQPTADESVGLGEGTKVDLAFRLVDGEPVGLQRSGWKAALAQAATAANVICARERQATKEWNEPISAPASNKEQDWHFYLRETQYRTKWSGEDTPEPSTMVLRVPSAPDFSASLQWLRESLTDRADLPHDLRAIGSPDIESLTTRIEQFARQIQRGQLRDVDLVIVADTAHAGRIRRALSQSGASLTIINPAQSFPQIKQRMQDERQLIVCQAPSHGVADASWLTALPFLALAGGIFLLRRA